MQIIQELKNKWREDKISTTFMGAVILLAILSFLKPNAKLTFSGLASYIGISMVNLLIIVIILVALWFLIRKK